MQSNSAECVAVTVAAVCTVRAILSMVPEPLQLISGRFQGETGAHISATKLKDALVRVAHEEDILRFRAERSHKCILRTIGILHLHSKAFQLQLFSRKKVQKQAASPQRFVSMHPQKRPHST